MTLFEKHVATLLPHRAITLAIIHIAQWGWPQSSQGVASVEHSQVILTGSMSVYMVPKLLTAETGIGLPLPDICTEKAKLMVTKSIISFLP